MREENNVSKEGHGRSGRTEENQLILRGSQPFVLLFQRYLVDCFIYRLRTEIEANDLKEDVK